MVYDGYGSLAEYLALGLACRRARPHCTARPRPPRDSHAAGAHRCRTSRFLGRRAGPCFSWLREDIERHLSTPDLFINTMETSELLRTWPAWLNRSRAVIVPTRLRGRHLPPQRRERPHCGHSGRHRSGGLPLESGLSARTDHAHGRPALRCASTPRGTPRKLAFAGDPDARLIIKSRSLPELHAG